MKSKLTLIKARVEKRSNHWYNEYKCDCGKIIITREDTIRESCGCARIKNTQPADSRLIMIKEDVKRDEHGCKFNRYKCKCGNTAILRAILVRSGTTKSCGCLSRETASKNNSTHRLRDTRLYSIWSSIKTRCFNKKASRYKDWGGRGILMCEEWKNDFKKFYDWAMSNGYSNRLVIDRENNDKNYEPNNCKWVTYRENNFNKRTTVMVNVDGEKISLAKICEKHNKNYKLVSGRIHKGWSLEKALFTPAKKIFTNVNKIKKIKRLLLLEEMTPTEIAESTNTKPQMVSDIKRGHFSNIKI